MNIDWKSIIVIGFLLPLLFFGNVVEGLANERLSVDVNSDAYKLWEKQVINSEFMHSPAPLKEIPQKRKYRVVFYSGSWLGHHVCSNYTESDRKSQHTYTIIDTDNPLINFEKNSNFYSFLKDENSDIYQYLAYTNCEGGNLQELQVEQPQAFKLSDGIINQFKIHSGNLPVIQLDGKDISSGIVGGEETDKEFEILFPTENSKITGYLAAATGTEAKFFDMKVKGKFKYNPEWYELDKSLEIGIIHSTIMKFSEHPQIAMNQGLGLKSGVSKPFKWIVEPGEGEFVEFEMLLQGTLRDWKGTGDLKIGISIPQNNATREEIIAYANAVESGLSPQADFYKWTTDTVKNITFTQNNGGDYVPPNPDEGETDGNTGGGGIGDIPQPPTNGGILEWLKYLIDLIKWLILLPFKALYEIITTLMQIIQNLVKVLNGYIGTITSIFTFLPSELKTLMYSSFSLMVSVSVWKFFRG